LKIRSYFTAPSISLFFIGLMFFAVFMYPNLTSPIPTFYKEWLAGVFALLAFIPLIRQTAWPAYQAPTIIWLPIAMLGVMALQLAALDIAYWQHYFLVAQYFVFAALLMLLGAMLKQAIGFDKALQGLTDALLVIGLISLVIIGLDISNIHLHGWVINSNVGAVANVGQQNHLATLLALAIASLALRYATQRIAATLAWPLFVLLLAGLALSASRSAWVFVLIITLGALFYRRWQNNSHANTASPKRLAALLALPVLFYALQVGLPHLPTAKPITTTNQRLAELAKHKDSPRLQLYQAAWYTYADNPLLGTGFGQMAWQEFNHAERVPKLNGTISHAHNMLLQFLAETGAVGATVLLVCMLAFLWRVKSAPISPERWLWWLMLAIMGTHAMLEYPLWYIHFLALASLLLGLGDIQTHKMARLRPQLLISIFAMLWATSLVQIMHDYRIIQKWYYQNQRAKLTDARYDQMFKEFQSIRAFSPLAIYAESQLINTLPIHRDGLQDKLAIYQRLLRAYPTPGLTYNYGILLALDGRQDEAIKHLKHAFMRYPGGMDQHWQRTTKVAVQGEYLLFKYIKYIEHLRDGEPLNNSAPVMMNNEQFTQPPINPAPEVTRG
jgi:O-antigen ligase